MAETDSRALGGEAAAEGPTLADQIGAAVAAQAGALDARITGEVAALHAALAAADAARAEGDAALDARITREVEALKVELAARAETPGRAAAARAAASGPDADAAADEPGPTGGEIALDARITREVETLNAALATKLDSDASLATEGPVLSLVNTGAGSEIAIGSGAHAGDIRWPVSRIPSSFNQGRVSWPFNGVMNDTFTLMGFNHDSATGGPLVPGEPLARYWFESNYLGTTDTGGRTVMELNFGCQWADPARPSYRPLRWMANREDGMFARWVWSIGETNGSFFGWNRYNARGVEDPILTLRGDTRNMEFFGQTFYLHGTSSGTGIQATSSHLTLRTRSVSNLQFSVDEPDGTNTVRAIVNAGGILAYGKPASAAAPLQNSFHTAWHAAFWNGTASASRYFFTRLEMADATGNNYRLRWENHAGAGGVVMSLSNTGALDVAGSYRVAGTRVLGPRQPAIPDLVATYGARGPGAANGSVSIGNGSALTPAEQVEYLEELRAKLNAVLAMLRTHGLIAP